MRMNDMVASARRMGVPREVTLLLSMMVRYLFVFWIVLKRIRVAQKTRLFDIWNRDTPRKWIIEQIGYTIGSLLIRSYEQGERTYISMLCRGYGSEESNIYIHKHRLRKSDVAFLLLTASILISVNFLPH